MGAGARLFERRRKEGGRNDSAQSVLNSGRFLKCSAFPVVSSLGPLVENVPDELGTNLAHVEESAIAYRVLNHRCLRPALARFVPGPSEIVLRYGCLKDIPGRIGA